MKGGYLVSVEKVLGEQSRLCYRSCEMHCYRACKKWSQLVTVTNSICFLQERLLGPNSQQWWRWSYYFHNQNTGLVFVHITDKLSCWQFQGKAD